MTRGSSAIHSTTVSLPASPLAGGTRSERMAVEARLGQIALDLVGGEAEPAMGELVAQEFLVMGVEVDHCEPPAGRQRPRGFGERPRRIVEKVQHLVDDHEVVGVAFDRRGVDVALTQGNVPQARLIDAGARQRQHRRALVDADGARRPRGEKLEHAAGARAEIEQIAERLCADHGDERRFDPLLRRVQRADLVPIGGARGEIGRRLLAPRLARDVEADAVGVHDRIGRIETAQPFARQRSARFGEAEEGPGALALPRRETRLDQQPQMTRDARLRLAENGDELAHGEFGGFEQAEDAQPRLLAGGLEACKQGAKGERRRSSFIRHKHIFMSIFDGVKRELGLDDLRRGKNIERQERGASSAAPLRVRLTVGVLSLGPGPKVHKVNSGFMPKKCSFGVVSPSTDM